MANNVTTTEERRAIRLAQINHVCETCGGRYDQTPKAGVRLRLSDSADNGR